jgi:succinate dehydrogenase/fumarate reductase-like Fe-S protein
MKRLHALALLAYYFWRHWLLKLTFRYDAGGENRFLSNYRPDHIAPLSRSERKVRAKAMSCIGCGLCDAVCQPAANAPDGPLSLSALMLAAGRDGTAAASAKVDADRLRCTDCGACEPLCPSSLPIVRLLAGLRGEEAA